MHLTKFRVRKFRNILDSGEIKVDESVTCLVGMNESGKTAVLTALHRLNPVDSGSFQEKYDYPRWLLARDRKEQLIDSVVPIEATFALDDSDVALLDDALGPDVVKPFDVTVSRRYNATNRQWTVPHDARRAVENLLGRVDIRKKTLEHFKGVKDLDGIEAVCARLMVDEIDTQADKTAEEVESIRAELNKLDGDTAGRVAQNLLTVRLPKFFYFSEYSGLVGRIDVAALDTQGPGKVG